MSVLAIVLAACSSSDLVDPNEGSDEASDSTEPDLPESCPMLEPTPGFALDFRIAVCDDTDCSALSFGPLTASVGLEEPFESTSLRLELECTAEELRRSDLDAGIELVLACELDPALPGDERLLVTAHARPAGASGHSLDVSLGDALTVRIESHYDGREHEPTRTAITRADDGALVVMHNLVSEPRPIEVRTRVVCEEESVCAATQWYGEMGFGSEGMETWVDALQAADLGGGLRAWVEDSNGFYGAGCGIYDHKNDIELLVARLR